MVVSSSSQELIDLCPGRLPVIRATGRDVTYELRIQGGMLATELFLPSPRLRLQLRCDADGNVFARVTP